MNPAALLDDAIHRRQTQPRALPFFLGREKWLEDMRLRFCIHAGAVVADRHLDIRTRLHQRMAGGIGLVEINIRGSR